MNKKLQIIVEMGILLLVGIAIFAFPWGDVQEGIVYPTAIVQPTPTEATEVNVPAGALLCHYEPSVQRIFLDEGSEYVVEGTGIDMYPEHWRGGAPEDLTQGLCWTTNPYEFESTHHFVGEDGSIAVIPAIG